MCFAHSNLDRAHLTGAKLGGATLSDALLRGTDLSGADLRGADLTRADLDGAILLGADLTSAELADASLRGVIADNTTTWPAGFTPPKAEVTREGGTIQACGPSTPTRTSCQPAARTSSAVRRRSGWSPP